MCKKPLGSTFDFVCFFTLLRYLWRGNEDVVETFAQEVRVEIPISCFNKSTKHISEVSERPHPLGCLDEAALVYFTQKPLRALNLRHDESKHHCVTAMTHWIAQP